MTITANRRTVLKAGAAGLGLAGAAPVLAGCSGDSVPGGGSGAAAEYEQGSAALEVELGPEIEGVNYPEDYVGPKHRELEPFGARDLRRRGPPGRDHERYGTVHALAGRHLRRDGDVRPGRRADRPPRAPYPGDVRAVPGDALTVHRSGWPDVRGAVDERLLPLQD